MQNIDADFDDALEQTLANRIAAYRRGETESFDADEVLNDLERSLYEGSLQ